MRIKFSGGARRDRTADLYNAIVALSQLSYDPNEYRELFPVSIIVSALTHVITNWLPVSLSKPKCSVQARQCSTLPDQLHCHVNAR